MARRLLRVSELLVTGLAAVTVVLGAVGLLYLLRPVTSSWPGPTLRQALPLDQLAGTDRVRLLSFVLVWSFAGLALGVLAFAVRIERLTAGILAALLTGGLLYATTGFSIFVVQQIEAAGAFQRAVYTPALYLATAFAALGGAAFGPRHAKTSRRAPLILAAFVAVSGLVDIGSVITPGVSSSLSAIENVAPSALPHLARALVVPTGLALVVLSRGLRRRRRRAWQVTTMLVIAAALLHILEGRPHYEAAVANTLLATVLIARRHDFAGRGEPDMRNRFLGRAVLYIGAIVLYGVVALWINRLAIDRPYTLGFAVRETAESAVGLDISGSRHVLGDFGDWFPLSVFLLSVTAAISLLWMWIAPWRRRVVPHEREWLRAHEIVSSSGCDSLAPFVLRRDKSYFFSDDERSLLAYTVVAGVAIVSGDPIGPVEEAESLLSRFIEFAHDRGWRVGILGAGERCVDLYRRLGLRVLYHGDEAVIEPRFFSLEGRPIRKVRQSVARLEREGYRAEVRYAGEIPYEERAELEDVLLEWRGGQPERGFTMELDTLFRLEGNEAVFVVGRDAEGAIKGFLHFAVVGRVGLSLSSMPRALDTPNGFNEWLVVEAVGWAKAHRLDYVSLNFAPFAAVFSDAEADAGRKLLRSALEKLKFRFQLDNLSRFNHKFQPRWQPRFVVYEHLGDIPRVSIAGLAAEGYLSLPGARR
jgi:lysyl-tRNA synthetase, class II